MNAVTKLAGFLVVVLALALPSQGGAQPEAETETETETGTEAGTEAETGTETEIEAEPEVSVEETHNALRAMRDGLLAAIEAKDADAMVEFFHPNAVLTTQSGTDLVAVRGRDGLRDYVERLFTGPDAGVKELTLNLETDELTILHGGDAGVAFGSSNDHYVLADGTEFDLATRWSATMVKEDGNWVIANFQIGSNLFSNPVLDAAQASLMWVGIGALALGLLVGFLVARLGRKKTV